MSVPKTAQGAATPLEGEEFNPTNPDLHRRVVEDRTAPEGEFAPRDYRIEVRGTDSYRVTTSYIHDESDDSEIP